jgi:tetratricopeptide (TPR) repeat protein
MKFNFFLFGLFVFTIVSVQGQSKNQAATLLFEQGEIFLNNGQYPEALQRFNQCLQQSPEYAEAYRNRAYIKQQLRDIEGANIDLSIYLEQKPDQPEALFSRATLRYQLGKYLQAKEDFTKLLKLPSLGETNTIYFKSAAASTTGVTEVMTVQSGNMAPLIFNYLGLIDTHLKKYASAIVWMDSAIALDAIQPDYYVNRALAKEGINDSTAMLDYKKALTINPNHSIALNNLSIAKRKQGDVTLADESLELAIESDSSMLYPYLERAYQRMEGGYYKGAEEDYTRALAVDDRDFEIWFNRGLAREKLKDWTGAYTDYTHAIELNEKLDKAWLGRGNVLTKLSKYNEAIEDFTVAILFRPDFALAFYNRAIAKEKLKQIGQACMDLNRAAELGMKVEARLKSKICGTP